MKQKKQELAVLSPSQREAVKQSQARKIRRGAFSTILTVVVIAAVVLLNVGVTLLDKKIDLSADFSVIQVTQIDDYSQEYVQNLKRDIEIIVNGEEEDFSKASYDATGETGQQSAFSAKRYTYELLKSFASHTDHISVHYIHTRYNPGFFKSRNITLDEDTFLTVYCPETGRNFQISEDVFNESEYIGLERRIDGAMESVAMDGQKTIAFLSGHDETLPGYLVSMLQLNAYRVIQLDLSTVEAIPDDVDCAVIVSPTSDYSANDIRMLRAFVSNGEKYGKSLVTFLDASTPAAPRLENFLEEWGIRYTTRTVFDRANSITVDNRAEPLIRLKYGATQLSDDVAGDLVGKKNYLYASLGKTRALERLTLYDGKSSADLLTSFGTGAFGVDYSSKTLNMSGLKDITMADDDVVGPFSLGALSYISVSERVPQGSSYTYYTRTSNVVAFGTTSLTETYFLSNVDGSSSATLPYMLNLFRYVTGRENYVMIYSTSLLPGTITFETDTVFMIACAVIIGAAPVVCFVISIIRRRKRMYL